MINNNFVTLSDSELINTDGGIIGTICAVIGTVLAIETAVYSYGYARGQNDGYSGASKNSGSHSGHRR